MKQVEEIIDRVTTTLGEVAQSDVVVGTPMEIGDVTVVPVCRISVGFGGAGGEGSGGADAKSKKTQQGAGRGSGSAGAAVVRPVAVIVLTADRVDVLTVPEKPGRLEKLIDHIPTLAERLKASIGS